MHEVRQSEPSDSFKSAWAAAGRHIQTQAGAELKWLRADLNLPMAEHLSFRIGNQVVFVYVDAAEHEFSHGRDLFMQVARIANAVPCLMKMHQRDAAWEPQHPGWGLTHAESEEHIAPPELVSDKLIEMSAWELHDFSIQIVCDYLQQQEKCVFKKQSSLEIDPSIWFNNEEGPSFVVVRAVRYPETDAPLPVNISGIKRSCSHISQSGFFASVSASNAADLELPLYRGHGMHVRFTGLVEL